VNYRSATAVRPLLDYIAVRRILTAKERRGPMETLLERYRGYLVGEPGLTPGTARCYLDVIRPFVATRVSGSQDGRVDFAGLTGAEVSGFILASCLDAERDCEADRDVAAVVVEIPARRGSDPGSVGRCGSLGGQPAAGRSALGPELAQVRRLLASCTGDGPEAAGLRHHGGAVPPWVTCRAGRCPDAGRDRLAGPGPAAW
jgi:hypothetical protein